jgi:hypothetical protein
MFLGKIHGGKLLSSVNDGYGSSWVLDEGVVALPILVCLLLQLHFDLDAFIDSLNHGAHLRLQNMGRVGGSDERRRHKCVCVS